MGRRSRSVSDRPRAGPESGGKPDRSAWDRAGRVIGAGAVGCLGQWRQRWGRVPVFRRTPQGVPGR